MKLNSINFENNFCFDVRTISDSITEKIDKYKLNDFYIVGQIQSFGVERLINYKTNNTSFQIIDKNKGISLFFSFIDNVLIILDIVDICNIFIVEGMDLKPIK